jgi:hypothetical protein
VAPDRDFGGNQRREFLRVLLLMPALTEADLVALLPDALGHAATEAQLAAHPAATPVVWAAVLAGEPSSEAVVAVAERADARRDHETRDRLDALGDEGHGAALAMLARDLNGPAFTAMFQRLAATDANLAGKALLLYPDTNLALLTPTELMPVLERGDTTAKLRAIQVIRYGMVLDADAADA